MVVKTIISYSNYFTIDRGSIMVKVKEDMTGWKMWEHGVPDSRLTVIKQVEDYVNPKGTHYAQWLCECNCGSRKPIVAIGSNLRRGHTLSCGCVRAEKVIETQLIDMTDWVMSEHGVPDSRVTVIRRVDDEIMPNGKHYVRYLCKCSCEDEAEFIARGSSLRDGNTKSCGCLARELISTRNKKSNIYNLSGEYGIGWTTNTNKEFYFDLEDYDKIKDYCWYEMKNGNKSGTYKMLAAHNPEDGKMVLFAWVIGCKYYDHINRNTFDNRKNNLRPCTSAENVRNTSIGRNNTSGVIGVSWNKQNQKWYAYLIKDGEKVLNEPFFNFDDAVAARLKAEKQYFGVFAPQKHLYEEYGIETTQNDLYDSNGNFNNAATAYFDKEG